MAWKGGTRRVELDPWREVAKAKVAAGEWTWDQYRAEYRKQYYALPSVIAARAVSGLMGPTLSKAVAEMAEAVRQGAAVPKKCAKCGSMVGVKWLVVDQDQGPTEHPWYCSEHRPEVLAEQRLYLAEQSGQDVRKMFRECLLLCGANGFRHLVMYAKGFSREELERFHAEAKGLKKFQRYTPAPPPAPLVKPAENTPPPAKNGLDSLLD